MTRRFINLLFRRRWIFIAATVASVLVSGFYITTIRVDNDTFKAVPTNIKPRLDYEKLRRDFPAPFNILLLAEFRAGTLHEKIDSLRAWSRRISSLKGIVGITDLTTLQVPVKRGFLGIGSGFIVPPSDIVDEKVIREMIAQNREFTRLFISEDESLLGMVIGLAWNADRTAIFDRMLDDLKIINKGSRVKAYITSEGAVSYFIDKSMRRDLRVLLPVCLAVIFILLYCVFHKILHVAASLCAVAVALIWTFGIFGFFRIPFSVITSIIPVIVFPIGVADAIHLIRFYGMKKNQYNGNTAALTEAWQELLKPCFLTSLTTFAGFASFVFSNISWCRTFGLFTGIAVMLCYVCNAAILPLFISFEKNNWTVSSATVKIRREVLLGRLWDFFIDATMLSKKWIAFIPVAALILVIGSTRGRVENNFMMMLPSENILRRSDAYIANHFGGSRFFSVVLEKRTGTITSEEDWKRIDTFTLFLKKQNGVGFVGSLLPLINRISRMLSNRDISSPAVSLITATEGLFGKSSDKLIADFLSTDRRRCRLQVICRNEPGIQVLRIAENVEKYVRYSLKDYNVLVSGPAVLSEAMSQALVKTLVISLLTTFIPVFLSLAAYFKSFRTGLFCIIPIILLTAFVYALMGLCSIPINLITVVIMNACIGIGIDYAIHFVAGYIVARKSMSDDTEALGTAIRSRGTPIFFNTVVVGIGFGALLFASFPPVRDFGLIVFLSMFLAAFFCMLILTLFIRNFGLPLPAGRKDIR